jgi:hypothetical protein
VVQYWPMGVRLGKAVRRSLAAVIVGVGVGASFMPLAASAGTLAVSLNAPVLATISVTTGTVSCAAGHLPCIGSTSVTGLIRSSRNQMSRIVVSGTSESAPAAAFAMTCADHSISTLHGALTLADVALITPGSDVTCAAWAPNPTGNVIAVDDTITFTNANASLGAALNFTVSLVVS